MTKNKPELIAPAGDFVSLQAAIQSGADAVYFGVEQLNMRRAATNFSLEELSEVVGRCRANGVRCYLTLNTIIFSGEVNDVNRILDAVRGKVDGVICWDPAVIHACGERQIPIHISTQASVSNPAAAKMYAQLGATRVVPARECTLEELRLIKSESRMALEVFVHGAMCVSVSGRCYLSDLTCGKSGNRGECQQNCRREYRITDLQEGHEFVLDNRYVMSAKDLCTLPFIEALCDAGVDAFKIEGRGRNPDYVRTVVRVYREAVDAWAQGALTDDKKAALLAELKRVYNRTFCDGFYWGRPISEFVDAYGGQATLKKDYVGMVTNYYRKAQVAEVNVRDNTFSVGAMLSVQGNKTGVVNFTPTEIRQHDVIVSQAARGIVTMPLGERVRVGDKVYRMTEKPSEHVWVRGGNDIV
ncbi:MAG: U32 family peptidase [Deltaproteobacteria bacterium]|nr:U32 family peptidase [Deltaproteobacteria bacterium]MBN2670294.1 U32 family peptidase [Deltaproteobacteria bacterium]